MAAERIILVSSVIGILLSGYLTYVHYAPEQLDDSFCNFSDFVSCSTVNSSSYATFFGMPVALIGVFGFLLLGVLSLGKVKYHRVLLFYFSLGALLFMLYLLIIELFVLKAICLYCVFVNFIFLPVLSIVSNMCSISCNITLYINIIFYFRRYLLAINFFNIFFL